jgi:hypothetical protein
LFCDAKDLYVMNLCVDETLYIDDDDEQVYKCSVEYGAVGVECDE